MKTYRTRISILLVIFIGISCYLPMVFIPESDKLFFFLMMTVFFVLIIACLFGIKYVIDGEILKIYSFYGVHSDINIRSITKMEKSRCVLSSPAASLDRLAVHYGKSDVVYISPRHQDDFIAEIEKIRS